MLLAWGWRGAGIGMVSDRANPLIQKLKYLKYA